MRASVPGLLLLVACATSEGVDSGPAAGGGPSGGGVAGALAGGAGGAAGTAGWPSGGVAGAAAAGGTSAVGGTSGSGGLGATGGGGTGATGGTSGTGAAGGTGGTGAGGTGATGGTGGAPACAIQGCTTGTETMSGCNAARTVGRKTAAVSPYYSNTASTCTSADKSTGYDSANCWDFGRDHLYRIFLRKGDTIDVTLTAGAQCSAATSWDRVFKIYGSSSCADTTCSQKIFCAATGSGTYAKSYTAKADGWHFLVVDGRTAITAFDDSGSYAITVKLTCGVSGCEC